MDLLAFAAKYWLEFVFTLLAGGITFILKRYMSLLKKEREEQREELKVKSTKSRLFYSYALFWQ